jgi:hypothetical protein
MLLSSGKPLVSCRDFLSLENTWHILIELISIFDFPQETVVYQAFSSYKRIIKYFSSEKKDDQVYQTIGQAGKKYIVYLHK